MRNFTIIGLVGLLFAASGCSTHTRTVSYDAQGQQVVTETTEGFAPSVPVAVSGSVVVSGPAYVSRWYHPVTHVYYDAWCPGTVVAWGYYRDVCGRREWYRDHGYVHGHGSRGRVVHVDVDVHNNSRGSGPRSVRASRSSIEQHGERRTVRSSSPTRQSANGSRPERSENAGRGGGRARGESNRQANNDRGGRKGGRGR